MKRGDFTYFRLNRPWVVVRLNKVLSLATELIIIFTVITTAIIIVVVMFKVKSPSSLMSPEYTALPHLYSHHLSRDNFLSMVLLERGQRCW